MVEWYSMMFGQQCNLSLFFVHMAVTSLCWQRSKPIVVNDSSCTAETALLGGAVEDSIIMPDPLPSSNLPHSTSSAALQKLGHSTSSMEAPFLSTIGNGGATNSFNLPTMEETPQRSSSWAAGNLTRLHASRTYNFKDDMEVFSPLVEVQPITPSLDKLWKENDGLKSSEKKPSFLLSSRRFSLSNEGANEGHPVFDWKSGPTSKQDDILSFPQPGSTSTPVASSKADESSSITPPEAWGGEKLSNKFVHNRQLESMPLTSMALLTSSGTLHSRTKEVSSSQEVTPGILGHVPFSSLSLPLGAKSISSQANYESTVPAALTQSRRFSTYAERISTTPSFGDASASLASPKTKKTGAETRENLLNSLLSRMDISSVNESDLIPSTNLQGTLSNSQRTSNKTDDLQQGSSPFTLRLFQRTLEETLASFQSTIHEDVRNLHIEILRQFHMQEIEMSTVIKTVLDNQTELMKEVLDLKKENQQLRQLL